ncbi:hypothetical protein AMECASPLE_005224 [Ameca splendens]|uniref:Uncharacterized protein n=1 Tax=Ameca splendens TaxID=208324 RepID=A0ABV0ZK06_9TELE
MPWAPPGGAGGGVWGEGRLGVSAESAAPATRSRIKRKTMSTTPLFSVVTCPLSNAPFSLLSDLKSLPATLTVGVIHGYNDFLEILSLTSMTHNPPPGSLHSPTSIFQLLKKAASPLVLDLLQAVHNIFGNLYITRLPFPFPE